MKITSGNRLNRIIAPFGTALFCVVATMALIFPSGALAAEKGRGKQAEIDSDRYQLRRDGNAFVRLDRETGEMSLCTRKRDQLVCRLAADERDALNDEIVDLQARIEQLEGERADTGPSSPTPPATSKRDDGRTEKPDEDGFDELAEAEIDRMVEYSGKVLRRFFTVMKDLREEFENKEGR